MTLRLCVFLLFFGGGAFFKARERGRARPNAVKIISNGDIVSSNHEVILRSEGQGVKKRPKNFIRHP